MLAILLFFVTWSSAEISTETYLAKYYSPQWIFITVATSPPTQNSCLSQTICVRAEMPVFDIVMVLKLVGPNLHLCYSTLF